MRRVEVTVGRQRFTQVGLAERWYQRLRGYMFRRVPAPYGGIIITPSNGVHMLFVAFPLQVLLFDRERKLIHQKQCRHFYSTAWHPKAALVLELPLTDATPLSFTLGDKLSWQ
ncbi:DUF192 domain-containing protein [Litorivicinus lipolyticus]|uniref:DUF192 domain-containing protein n=1 Tax=Litorivicinus lipolyticus TaxID=418701 RepID=UPI003B5CF00C